MAKQIKITLTILCCALALMGCKRQDWLDWKAQNELWLQQNLMKPYAYGDSIYKVEQTHSGLQYVIIKDPSPYDAHPSANSTVNVDYTIDLINTVGTKYHIEKATHVSLQLSGSLGVIPGFAEGIKKIHANGDIMLFIPYELGYKNVGAGAEGGTGYIPPFSTLIYEIHLNAIQ